MGKKTLIILSGSRIVPESDPYDLVICADSGYISAFENGIDVDLLVGDMDSLPFEYIETARKRGIEIIFFPREKDISDGEIALRAALERNSTSITISGGKEGRLDHVLSTALLPFTVPEGVMVDMQIGDDRLFLLRSGSKLEMDIAGIVSIIPLSNGTAVTTEGLRWPLNGDLLELGGTRGIHNESKEGKFRIRCDSGSVWVVISKEDK